MATYREPWEYWNDKCAAEDEYAKYLPVCDDCGDVIADDEYYEIGDAIYCPECMKRYCKSTEDYVAQRRYWDR